MSQEKSSQRTNLWRPIIAMVFELWRAHPIAFIALIATTVIPGFSYIAYTLATRGLINALVESPTPGAWDIPTYMLLYIAAILVEMTMNMLRPIIMVYLRDHATHHIQSRIYEQATEAPLIRFEDSAFYDCLRRANNNLGDRLTELLNGLLHPLWQFSIAASIAGTLFVVHPWIIPILAFGIIPSLLLQSKRARMVYDVQRKHTLTDRLRHYYQELLTDRQAAAEVRLFDLSRFLHNRWMHSWRTREKDVLNVYKRDSGYHAFGGFWEWLSYAGVLSLIIYSVVMGQATIGDLAVVISYATRFQNFLQGTVQSVGNILEHSEFLGDAFEFFALAKEQEKEPTEKIRPSHIEQASNKRQGLAITARDITFTYPSRTDPVVKNVTLQIQAGEKIAIVGENGAGKTTLVKLLIGLYAPDSGEIYMVDGDIEKRSPEEVQSRVAAVFQDYAKFDLKLRENIGFGQLDAMSDDTRLYAAAHRADILDIHSDLSDGWDGYLGRKFGDRDLSGGQWQKVALGRAYLKDADLVVLDEPTSALDPKAELALFERFVDLTENRTALMISHRLGAARLADRVIVMKDGQIIESDSHRELLKLNGEYARLFSAQAQWYR
ncbi:MAG: ABC transporter ATP-binding protein [Gemmatimonadetes bacterium]|nr:ABC transporter ATP-binding protein [Gemmatimonadota bacterium]MYB56426.1 ABC transporter ATP-binding protein [Gemmatimonadota bacterium]